MPRVTHIPSDSSSSSQENVSSRFLLRTRYNSDSSLSSNEDIIKSHSKRENMIGDKMVQNFDSPLNPSQETNVNEELNLSNAFNQSMDIDQDTGMDTGNFRDIKSVFFT